MAEDDSNLGYSPLKCSSLKKNGFVLLNNNQNPCKIVSMSTSKTGKHGGAKVHMVGIDIFNGKKFEELCGSTANMNVPDIDRYDLQLCDIVHEDFNGNTIKTCNVLDDSFQERSIPFPEDPELAQQIQTAFEDGANVNVTVMYCKAIDHEQIMGYKEIKDQS